MQNSQCIYAKGKVGLTVACSVSNGKILVSGYFLDLCKFYGRDP